MEHLLNRYEAAADAYHMENMDSQRVSPSNVPYLLTYIQRDAAGHMDPNATINALCAAIRTAEEVAADEIRELIADRDAAERDAAENLADLIRLREYAQLLELQYADALGELDDMTKNRDGLANILARAYGKRWGNPGEHGVQRLHADTLNRAA